VTQLRLPHADLDSLPAVLTVEEAAAVLRIGRAAAYAAVRAGEIASVRFGRTVRVPRAALLQLLGEPIPDTEPTPERAFAGPLANGGTPHE
jgi:excisionase family DNA binding protein